RAEDAHDVRCAKIAGAVLSEIDAARSAGDVGRRYRAGETGDYDADDWRHLRRRAPHDNAEWIAAESPDFTKRVVQIPHVVLLHEVGIVAEDSDCRRCRLHLRRVIELDLAAGGLWGLAPADNLLERGVHLRGADALVT